MTTPKQWRLSRRWLIAPPVLIGLAVVIVLAGRRQQLPRTEPAELAVPVNVLSVEPEPIRQTVIGYGTARPERIWTAVAEVGGRVVEVAPDLESGARVGRGDWLL